MKVVKALLVLTLVAVVAGVAAYGLGRVLGAQDDHNVAVGPKVPAARHTTASPGTPLPTPTTPSPSRTASPSPKPAPTSRTTAPTRPTASTTPTSAPLRPGKPLYEAGDEGTEVRSVQARLKQIAWYYGDVTGRYDAQTVTAVRGFQAKREIPVTGKVDQRTLDRLRGMTTTPTHAELFNVEPPASALDPRCRTGRVLCIDKTSRTLRWVVDGHVGLTLDARFGSTVSNTPTREGLFHVYLKDADHVSRLYGSSMPFSMFFSGGQAVHYSSDFATYGYAGASHGCVNIRDYDGIKWLFSQVHVGDKVVVYWS